MHDRAPIDLWTLRIFADIAATRSMTAAARRLGLTQSAVSQAVRRLETELAVQLIERGRRPIALTAAGTVLERRAEALLRDAAQLPQALRDANDMPAQDIRLGFVDTFASTAAPELIRQLTTTANRVVVWSGLAPSLGKALTNRELDAIVTSDALDDHDGLKRIILWTEPFLLLLPRAYRPRSARHSLEAVAADLPMIRYSARSHMGLNVERQLRRQGLAPERRIEVDGSDALVAMVAAGLGWAITTPLCLLQGSAHLAEARAVRLGPAPVRRVLSLVWRDGGPDALARRAATLACGVLRDICLPRLRTMIPEMEDGIGIGP